MVFLTRAQADALIAEAIKTIEQYMTANLPENPTEEDMELAKYQEQESIEDTLDMLAKCMNDTIKYFEFPT
jgi:hypothetical protein